MFDLDKWTEIFDTIRKNKLRTFLTGLSISWGIFMFCFLLCAGNGLKNGVTSNFASRSVNSYDFWGRRTSKPYQGFPDNRPINLNENDLRLAREQLPQTVHVSGRISTDLEVSYKSGSTSCSFQGVEPEYMRINGIKISDGQGRFVNDMDMKENRKVAVINRRAKDVLFRDSAAVGKQVIAGGLGYTVIGVFTEDSWGNDAKAYIPFSTAMLLYNKGRDIGSIHFTVNGLETKEKNEVFKEQLRKKLAGLHVFDLEDERSVGIWSRLEDYLQTQGIFNGISAFIWIIGIGTLIAGVISIGNIMLITVRERTREFGIRKAIGAKPSSIMGSILMESVLMTSVFGYAGMFLGVGTGELINSILLNLPPEAQEVSHIFQNPTIEVNIAVGAMLILIVSGVLAGAYPAWKASRISPVIAMKEE
ncbi:MAG: ABC transporter permease [Dysgonamonadaceae bacterium]|jgi:putative ABC transport system permease protein|nr:ABC transporter permease [Dysgonamonadaceae bacterium]